MDDIAILLVESLGAEMADLAALLGRHGYRTQRVSVAGDALAALETHEPSLVFVGLHHADAALLCQRLRETAVGATTPMIMLGAAQADIQCIADALAIGADFFFAAPWDEDAVLAKVRTYVGEGGAPCVDAEAELPEQPATASTAPAAPAAPPSAAPEAGFDLTERLQALAQERAVANQNVQAPVPTDNTVMTQPPAQAAGATMTQPPAQASPAKPPSESHVAPPNAGQAEARASNASRPAPSHTPVALPEAPSTDLMALIQAPSPPAPRPGSRLPVRLVASVPYDTGTWASTPPAGSLDATCHVAHVLAQAWTAQATGRMDWQQGDVRVCLWLFEGSPCGYSSNLAHDNLAEFLSRTGSIRQAACRQLRLQTLPNARLTLAYLVRLGEISAEKVWPLLTAHLAEQTYGLFGWEVGTFAWHQDPMPIEDRITLEVPTPGWLLEGMRRKYDLQRLVPHIGGPASMVAQAAPGTILTPNLHLGPAEAHMIDLLDGTRTLEDITSTCRTQLVETYRMALLLVMLRHAQITTRGASGALAGAGGHPIRDAQRISEKLQQVRLCDYFEILGLPANASDYEVTHAADALRAAFDPGAFTQDLAAQYASDLAEIAEIIGDARDVLGERGKREAYATHLG